MKLLVLGHMPATAIELLNKLYMVNGGEIEIEHGPLLQERFR